MKYNHIQKFSTWVLLVAYLPLLTASVLHRHDYVAGECQQCLHHPVHAAHWAPASVDGDCMYCHLLGQTYVPQSQLGVEGPHECWADVSAAPGRSQPERQSEEWLSLRAPPAC